MKKNFILLPFIGGLLYVTLSGSAGGPGAIYGDRTGATASTMGCNGGCHGASATTTNLAVQLFSGSSPVTSYVGGSAYTIRITGIQTSSTDSLPYFGFQVSVVKTGSTTVNEGTLSAIAGTHLGSYGVPTINIVEHSAPIVATTGTGRSGTTYVVNIPWTAPVSGTGSVTIYTSLNAVNHDGSYFNDRWNNTSYDVAESVGGVAPITGSSTVCVGATTPLTDATPGGVWSSSHTAAATIGTSGVVTGVAVGTSIISYTVGITGTATTVISVIAQPSTPAAITGSAIICVGKTTPLGDATAGGNWISSNTANATINATGVVTGVAVGTTIISYTMTNTCGTAYVTRNMSVHASGTCNVGVGQVAGPAVNELRIFPNPNDGTFTINLGSDEHEQANVLITNLVGTKINEFTIGTNSDVNMKLNAPPGIYFISATTAHGTYISKMLLN